ncbi:MAG TPA: sortase [Candidatus Paceibacterota bacterium]|nr:sortase [Candidatus Pacearchaeota archaeon]HRZ51418.1 sortase [Candidatus Paceibacterota bacterium]HSA37140.1 sortase [Candidatus Paceibacterota bacterium]
MDDSQNIVVYRKKNKNSASPLPVKLVVLILAGILFFAVYSAANYEKVRNFLSYGDKTKDTATISDDMPPVDKQEAKDEMQKDEDLEEANEKAENQKEQGELKINDDEEQEGEGNNNHVETKSDDESDSDIGNSEDGGDSDKQSEKTANNEESGSEDAETLETKEKLGSAKSEDKNTVIIRKIGSKAPIIKTASTDLKTLHDLLDHGVVLYPGSAAFGETGLTVILGHSAPAGWPNIKYDHAFSKLNLLAPGDMVDVDHNGSKYYYRVLDTQIIERGGSIVEKNPKGNTLVLMSCWPPGKDRQRIVVQAAFVHN